MICLVCCPAHTHHQSKTKQNKNGKCTVYTKVANNNNNKNSLHLLYCPVHSKFNNHFIFLACFIHSTQCFCVYLSPFFFSAFVVVCACKFDNLHNITRRIQLYDVNISAKIFIFFAFFSCSNLEYICYVFVFISACDLPSLNAIFTAKFLIFNSMEFVRTCLRTSLY